jgi:hypothetical protein
MKNDLLEVMQETERLVPSIAQRSHGITKFEEKLSALISLIVNERGFRTTMRKAMLEEAATVSEFPILFGTILDRQLLAKYSIYKPDWRNYIKVGSQMDFRPQQPIGVFGLQGALAAVPSRDEYKQDAKLGSGAVQITLTKFGRRFGLGWEVLINDDLSAFSDIAERLANAASRTEYRQATALLINADGNGPNTVLFGAPIAHPVDGKNVTNKFTGAGSALSVTSVARAVQAFREFVDADNEPILIDGFEMVVPPALEVTMYQVLQSQLLIAAGGDGTAGAKAIITPNKNVIPNFSITGHVNAYLPILDTSANKNTTWYMIAKLANGAAVQLNFLRGHETPELVMKNPNKLTLGGATQNPLEGDFESDAIDWRVRHIMGGAVIDPRMAIVSVGA